MEHKVANPAPLGLFGFALTTALLQGAVTGITEGTTEFQVIGLAMFYGGLCQLLAGMWEFRRKNTFGAAAFSSYGGFWMSFALVGICSAADIFLPSPKGKQMMLSLWGILTFIFFVGALSLNIALQALFLLLSIVFFLLAGGLHSPMAEKAGGWLGLVVAGIAFYAGAADLINERFKKTLLPVGNMDWVPILIPAFRRAIGCVPLLGLCYLRAVEHEDELAGYAQISHLPIQGPAHNGGITQDYLLKTSALTTSERQSFETAPRDRYIAVGARVA